MALVTVATCTDITAAITAPGAVDCNGVALNLATAQLATCANVDSKIDAALTAPGATDCAGAAINLKTAQLMTCGNLPAEMCEALAALPAAGVAGTTTLLIGADCKAYTLPATPVDLNVTNFQVVGSNLELTDQDGSVFQIPLSSLIGFKMTDCNGVQFAPDGTTWATCQNVDSKITAALQAPGAKDCAGAAIDLTTASLATCTDITALQAAITALQTTVAAQQVQINNILAALANTDTLTDCQGNVLAKFVVG